MHTDERCDYCKSIGTVFFFVALRPNAGHGLLVLEVYLDHTQRRITVGRTPPD
jgi:hypothetical protein